MSYSTVNTFDEACDTIDQLGILPLSSFIPNHPSLVSITHDEAWHTGMESDPWLWRDYFAGEGVAAYGRFIAGKPIFISRQLFPLVKGVLSPSEAIADRYAAGVLARSTMRMYECIRDNDGIDVKRLRTLTGMQGPSKKRDFDRSLIELQGSSDIVISGISERLNEHGNKSGWNSTCYMLADRWMVTNGIVPTPYSPEDAKAILYSWITERWNENAIRYLKRYL